jgi:hypothetical protein
LPELDKKVRASRALSTIQILSRRESFERRSFSHSSKMRGQRQINRIEISTGDSEDFVRPAKVSLSTANKEQAKRATEQYSRCLNYVNRWINGIP